MDKSVLSPRSAVPNHLITLRRRFEQGREQGSGAPVEQGGAYNDAVQVRIGDDELFLIQTPGRKFDGVGTGCGVGDDVLAVFAMDPCPGCVYVGEPRSGGQTQVFSGGADR